MSLLSTNWFKLAREKPLLYGWLLDDDAFFSEKQENIQVFNDMFANNDVNVISGSKPDIDAISKDKDDSDANRDEDDEKGEKEKKPESDDDEDDLEWFKDEQVSKAEKTRLMELEKEFDKLKETYLSFTHHVKLKLGKENDKKFYPTTKQKHDFFDEDVRFQDFRDKYQSHIELAKKVGVWNQMFGAKWG